MQNKVILDQEFQVSLHKVELITSCKFLSKSAGVIALKTIPPPTLLLHSVNSSSESASLNAKQSDSDSRVSDTSSKSEMSILWDPEVGVTHRLLNNWYQVICQTRTRVKGWTTSQGWPQARVGTGILMTNGKVKELN